ESGATKSGYILLSRPGLRTFALLGDSTAVLAEVSLNGRAFAIGQIGATTQFYEVHADQTITSYGSPLAGDLRPQMEPSQTQVLILSGGLGYIFDLRSNTLTQITAPGFPAGAVKAAYLDGYFILLEPNSQT